jgi:hypothetical protein
MFMLGCGVFGFGWIGAALVLVIGDSESRQQVLRIFGYLSLWLAVIPLCSFGVSWFWRWQLAREISEVTNDAT